MIVCVVGPTGVGKTKLSIELAKRYKAIIISCDATQVYKELNIGSAKVTEREKENVPHYLIDFVSPNDTYTVYNYQKDIRELLDKYQDRNIIIVGGSGLYLKSALYNYEFREENNLNNTYDNLSNEELYNMALKKDKDMNIHINNRQRLIRFLNKENINETLELKPIYNATYIGLTTNRDNLYNIINKRVDKMINDGLINEVELLYQKYPDSKILHSAIGYKELIKYLDKEMTLEEATDLIKKNSRHYAKRQYTWFNNQMNITWFDVDYNNFNNTINDVIKYLEKK